MFDLEKAAKTGVDEAAIKLAPLVDHGLDGLKEILQDLFAGHKLVISIEKKDDPK